MIVSMAATRVAGAIAERDAFALGQPRRLDHQRLVAHADVFLGRVWIGKRPRLGGRHGLVAHQFLGEPLVRLKLRRLLRRPEDFHARAGESDRPIPPPAGLPARSPPARSSRCLHESLDLVELHDRPRHDVGQLRNARISRQRIKPRHLRRIRQLPRQRMLPSAVADNRTFIPARISTPGAFPATKVDARRRRG